MLAMSDRYGRVWASIPGLAKEAAVSVDAARFAIDKFLNPDPDSRTKIAEGRRIVEIDGGWKLINHAKYRAIRDEEERRAYKTEKQREYRSKVTVDMSVDNVDTNGPMLNGVDSGGHNAEAYTEADTDIKAKPSHGKREVKHSKDHRHIGCKNEIFSYYRDRNEGEDPDWEGREGKALGMFLNANPKLTAEGMKRLLTHRAESTVNHSERPALWISKLTSFRMGPLNEYGKPVNSSNGHVKVSPRKQEWDEFMAKEI